MSSGRKTTRRGQDQKSSRKNPSPRPNRLFRPALFCKHTHAPSSCLPCLPRVLCLSILKATPGEVARCPVTKRPRPRRPSIAPPKNSRDLHKKRRAAIASRARAEWSARRRHQGRGRGQWRGLIRLV